MLNSKRGSLHIIQAKNTLKKIGSAILVPLLLWLIFFLKGKQFALKDRLRKADALVVLTGTRGNIKFLEGKIRTAANLYKKGWAPILIASGKFSAKSTDKATLVPLEELQAACKNKRIEENYIPIAAKICDTSLGAAYIRDQAIKMDIPQDVILVEDESLHTRENAEYTLNILKKYHMQRIILITSPFHQLRTYLTFAKVFQAHNIEIINYHADTEEWHPATWFLSAKNRKLVKSERERIKKYRAKGDLL
ncbi:YdcF family protein [Ktedonosporobacter rubrisoli]|uniref:YdcF family protein n=1 Tax=Ktedonosporobacter rubrisoli TaxID=2509675 RepID=UPI0013EE4BBB|nr:YdcF family protein [Ktedonosporobacter rubrisoli]